MAARDFAFHALVTVPCTTVPFFSSTVTVSLPSFIRNRTSFIVCNKGCGRRRPSPWPAPGHAHRVDFIRRTTAMLIENHDQFFAALSRLYENSREKGTVWITLKRRGSVKSLVRVLANPRGHPVSYEKKPKRKEDESDEEMEAASKEDAEDKEHPCIVRAVSGKKKLSIVVYIDFLCSMCYVRILIYRVAAEFPSGSTVGRRQIPKLFGHRFAGTYGLFEEKGASEGRQKEEVFQKDAEIYISREGLR